MRAPDLIVGVEVRVTPGSNQVKARKGILSHFLIIVMSSLSVYKYMNNRIFMTIMYIFLKVFSEK